MHHQLMTLLSLNVVIWSLVWGLLSSLTGCTVSSARSEQEFCQGATVMPAQIWHLAS